jgi:hypothetical protein
MRMLGRKWMFAGLLAFALLGSSVASATDWNIVLNGKSVHLNASESWNEDNWGLGFEREFLRDGRWVPVVVGNGFRASDNEMSYMAGGGIKRRFWIRSFGEAIHVDLGVVGFVMTRHDHNGNEPFPGLLPALSVGTRRAALNVTYLPETAVNRINRRDPTLSGVIFLQLKLDSSLLRPARQSAGHSARQH